MADTWNFPNFMRAVVRELSDSVTNSSYTGGRASKEPLDVEKCKSEWGLLVQTMRDLGLDVTVLPQDPERPDCLFVDDPCVVIGDTALITRPADETRRGEVSHVLVVWICFI
ncbi:N(G),N(G)-dimethylarginine dimethylaminohydrolase 1-like [Branchiostoma floridae]|uniref:N(G),N(G)-dimethylarginine dimethylaminohydrolase 1-like n=1 Tax=Branchiostoma floridae TaxID=7739 RepID=A0A9J7KIQ0_BRAFL|nr:N(G),N(G)-dimethylarginine dimethylaminohydrolase 1-like [Branchiostoma floridae]